MRATTIVILAAAAIAACGGRDLEVRTFELDHLGEDDAEALLAPYVRSEEGGIFTASGDVRAITVRETPGTLDEIERVLAEHDRGSRAVRLEFVVLEAGTLEGGGDESPGVDTLLRDVLKYEDYRTVARAVVQTSEGARIEQSLGLRRVAGGYLVRGNVGRVTGEEVELDVQLDSSAGDRLLRTSVTVPIGQTVVLGTAMESDPDAATILTVRPALLEAPEAAAE